ncbi:MAG TPA: 3-oxoacyl-ACP synthase [Gemmatimonadetes bacterium]|nr:3-oxoacyl-ACP synthase [Gemmatimonadota bacterium]HAT38361.1 3-oxoacyl-ACP synthase [Gemmatimonadota bacterium]HBV05336.1 3-oxoacyl-ACP synthase [Gemmatimonadota bacterium]HCO13313.1 3-oxoacyl-ACP synthase [Gemmatimonadota bacterium]
MPTPIAEITGTGRFLPDNVVTNLDLERSLDTTDEWIRTRTGIKERRIAPDDMYAAHLGAEAARGALEEAGVEPGDVEILIISTATPDRWLPSTACDVQAILGCDKAVAFDVMAACTGHLYALSMAEGYIAAGRARVALVVAAEKMSAIVDWTDRKTAVLFGDGGGAAVLQPSNGSGRGILSSHLQSDGNLANLLYRPGGGAVDPISQSMLDEGRHLLRMNGREIFKNAVRSMAEACDIAIRKAGLRADDVDLLVPHQANIRIIEATAKYAGVPMDKVFVNVDKYGNMSSATVPVAFDEAREQGRIGEGSNVVTVAFGAGLTWGAMAIRM